MAEAKERLDRLSELPDNVINHIMSFLHEEDIVSTAVSSKTWRRVRSTHTALNIHQSTFISHRQFRDTTLRERFVKFIDFVNQTLRKFLESKAILQKFKLSVYCEDTKHFPILDDWINFAFRNNNVAEIELCFYSLHDYILPQTPISSKLLTVLILTSCELYVLNLSSNSKCESLRELRLDRVRISENVIQCLINSFPCIVNFVLFLCNGFNHIKLCNLNMLKNVELSVYSRGDNSSEIIHIEAPSLRSFKLVGCYYNKCEINLDACRNLEVLHFEYIHLPTSFFQELCSDFPILRSVCLCYCYNLGRLKIVGQCLESLILKGVDPLVNATIDTPNLRSFNYSGNLDESFLFSMDTPRVCEATLDQRNGLVNSTLFFSKLRALIGKLRQIRILSLHISSWLTFDLEELKDIRIPQLCHVKHVKLVLHVVPLSYIGLADGILWCCHPETIYVAAYNEVHKNFIKVLYDGLRERKTMQNCCESSCMKCWRHELKDFEVEGFAATSSEETLAVKQTVIFKLEW